MCNCYMIMTEHMHTLKGHIPKTNNKWYTAKPGRPTTIFVCPNSLKTMITPDWCCTVWMVRQIMSHQHSLRDKCVWWLSQILLMQLVPTTSQDRCLNSVYKLRYYRTLWSSKRSLMVSICVGHLPVLGKLY